MLGNIIHGESVSSAIEPDLLINEQTFYLMYA